MSTPLVSARDLQLRYGETTVLDHLDLDISASDHLAVTGRSGSGKTTLLLVLAGLLSPSQGEVTWPDLPLDRSERQGQIGMVFQAPSLMPELTAIQNVMLPLRLRGVERATAQESSSTALARVSALDLAEARPSQLSGGQQQRVAIARALAGNHRLVLADEPTGALDRAHAHEVAEALMAGVRSAGGALVLATHDPDLADMLDRQLVISDGRLGEGERIR